MAKPHGPLSPAAAGLGGVHWWQGQRGDIPWGPRGFGGGSVQLCALISPPRSTSPGSKRAAGCVPSITPGVATRACWPHPAALSPSPESGGVFTPGDLKPCHSQGHPGAGSHFGNVFRQQRLSCCSGTSETTNCCLWSIRTESKFLARAGSQSCKITCGDGRHGHHQ